MPDPRHLAIKDPHLRAASRPPSVKRPPTCARPGRRSPDRPADLAAAEPARAARVAALAKYERKHPPAGAAELAAQQPPTTKAG
jgi:hypothetical protein